MLGIGIHPDFKVLSLGLGKRTLGDDPAPFAGLFRNWRADLIQFVHDRAPSRSIRKPIARLICFSMAFSLIPSPAAIVFFSTFSMR